MAAAAGSKIPGERVIRVSVSGQEVVRWTDICSEGVGCEQDVPG